jgi:hypothetical protein
MKKILISILLTVTLAQAGVFSVVTSMGMESKDPSKEYKLNTSGWSPRIYEFRTTTIPQTQCVVVFSSSNGNSSPSMQCIPINK